jgi:putative nucleotidyltransferase with HDIG domain
MDNTVSISAKHQKGEKVLLLFTPRQRISDILNVALIQCDYKVLRAETSYLAMIKANQFLPDLIIVDITPNNTKDILLISRLQKSLRTKHIPILIIIPTNIKSTLESLQKDIKESKEEKTEFITSVLEYPFNFATLLKKIESLLEISKEKELIDTTSQINGSTADKSIGPKLFDTNMPMENKLRLIESIIHKQWAFPFTVIKALDIIGSDASCCNELAKCIETDLAASTAILKVANAVYYAKRGSRVTDVKEAVVRLGFRETNNLLACLALIDLSPEHRKNYGFTRHDFWLHSLATGLIAEKLCKDCGHIKPELAFIAGLIHDLGKIPLDNNFDMLFPHLLEETANNMCSFYSTEQRLMGFSHSELGHYLTSKWNFPSSITMAILNHHKPNLILESPTPMERIIQEAVFTANILSKIMGIGHSCDEICEEIPQDILKSLKIPNGPSELFFSPIYRDLYVLCKYLGIPSNYLQLTKQSFDQNVSNNIIIVLNKKYSYHPIITALRNNGFMVRITNSISQEIYNQASIIIFIPDKGFPLDIMFYDEEKNISGSQSTLKIFLVENIPEKSNQEETANPDVVFFNRKSIDLRILLHTIDRFLGKIVVPEKEIYKIPEEEH